VPKSHLPKWLRTSVKEADIKTIENAVKAAELQTSGELVPMIVHRSSVTGHVPVLLLLILGCVFFAFQHYTFHWMGWTLLGSFSIACLFSERSDWLCRWLSSRDDQALQVEQRALQEFHQHRLSHTQKSTGILIFISIMEHRAVVLGDKPIAEKLPQETWDKILDVLVGGIKKRQTIEGLQESIRMCGEVLKVHFPIDRQSDKNELSNQLIIKE
jgi:putative membrane protein